MGLPLVRLLTTTDHKTIGKLYLGTSFAWFLIGGIMAVLMRSELANPGMQFVNDEVYNQLFTMHHPEIAAIGIGEAVRPGAAAPPPERKRWSSSPSGHSG